MLHFIKNWVSNREEDGEKGYVGCCTLNKEIEASFRVNEYAYLEKASEVQIGEGGNKTVMKGGNIDTVIVKTQK